jgi:hypothetical protein
MNYKQISQEIEYDIDRGVYDRFPKLKKRLLSISSRLTKAFYLSNRDIERSDYIVLEENDYV